jgi:starvation-inducible DNA-binding protein
MKPNVLEVKAHKENVKTGLSATARAQVAERLTEALADTVVLMLKSQVFHWNVVGPSFVGLHKLTEQHYQDLFAAADELAERIRALGSLVPFSSKIMARSASVGDELAIRSTETMIEELIADHEAVVRSMRETAEDADKAGDIVTHDLLVRRMDFHEKAIWMLRAIAAK